MLCGGSPLSTTTAAGRVFMQFALSIFNLESMHHLIWPIISSLELSIYVLKPQKVVGSQTCALAIVWYPGPILLMQIDFNPSMVK